MFAYRDNRFNIPYMPLEVHSLQTEFEAHMLFASVLIIHHMFPGWFGKYLVVYINRCSGTLYTRFLVNLPVSDVHIQMLWCRPSLNMSLLRKTVVPWNWSVSFYWIHVRSCRLSVSVWVSYGAYIIKNRIVRSVGVIYSRLSAGPLSPLSPHKIIMLSFNPIHVLSRYDVRSSRLVASIGVFYCVL